MISTGQLYAYYQRYPLISTDTRQLPKDCIFFALKGEKFDGNQYAAQALDQGAAYAVVDDPTVACDARFLLVPNVLEALQHLATHHRRQFDIPVIAIGGSNGKTTTKELVAAVLSSHYDCHYTKGNLNNHIGVPLTLLGMPATAVVAVIETGANHPGEIDELCRIAEPTHGLITNIGKEHLEGFGNLEGVKQAEGELYRYLARTNGWAFVNASEKYLRQLSRGNKRKIIYETNRDIGQQEQDRIGVVPTQITPFVTALFRAEDNQVVQVQSRLFGQHNFQNIMTAIALGIYFRVPAPKIKAAIEAYTPSNNRSQVVQRGTNTYIMDAYNANPSSVAAAIESARVMPAAQKVAVLGDMLELGPDSPAEHQIILRKALRAGFDRIVLVGAEFGGCKRPGTVLHFPDTAAAKVWLDAQAFEHTLFLVKGSRGIRLEGIL
jgi:UDP-N-acetylmuramoyl-tripeptide--D-alanyl-D-alanine ligase